MQNMVAPPPPPAATNFPPLLLHPVTASGLTVCVVVPCVPKHLEHLPEVLASVDEQTEPAAHVVVALSETDGDSCALVVAKLRAHTTTPLTLSCVATPVGTRTAAATPPTLQPLQPPSHALCTYALPKGK